MTHPASRFLFLLVVASTVAVRAAGADPIKCQTAISKASSGFVQVWAKAEQKCRDAIVKGKLPPATNCEFDIKVVTAAGKATAKLRKTIAKACGGKDKICGTGDTDEAALADIGWNIGTCPDFDNDGCNDPITSCDGIASCVRCVGDVAVDEALELSYDSLTASNPKTQKALSKCQTTIGKAMTKLVTTKSKALTKCWAGVLKQRIAKGKIEIPGPCPDAKTSAKIAAAAAKKDAAIVKACQGPDKTLGTPDDFTPAEIGFPSNCLDTEVPSCAGPVTTLQNLIDCVDCVSEHDIDCADAVAVPGLVTPYPASCNVGP